MMHLVVGTPMYGGMCCSEYTQSMLQLQSDMERNGHKLTCVFLGNESLIQRARNTVAHHFLETDASHLLFIDADQKFVANDIARMIKADKGIIDARVAVRVKSREYRSNSVCTFREVLVMMQSQLVHGPEDAPLHRLESVTHIRQCPTDDHAVVRRLGQRPERERADDGADLHDAVPADDDRRRRLGALFATSVMAGVTRSPWDVGIARGFSTPVAGSWSRPRTSSSRSAPSTAFRSRRCASATCSAAGAASCPRSSARSSRAGR